MKTNKLFFWVSLICLSILLACTKKSDDTNNPDGENPTEVDISANLLAAGESANDILSNDTFTKMKIEITYVRGLRPSEEAMTAFVDYLKTYTFKENIEMIYRELPSPGEATLSIQEIGDLEIENRTVYTSGDTLGFYIYFTDTANENDDRNRGQVVLGSVYRNTSMVIYEAAIQWLAARSNPITTADIEIATINHEFGHLFGLVDLGTTPVNEHEDDEVPNHCNVEGCLMRAKLQFTVPSAKSSLETAKNELKSSCSLTSSSVVQMLNSKTSKGFENSLPLDPECILDLRSNGGR